MKKIIMSNISAIAAMIQFLMFIGGMIMSMALNTPDYFVGGFCFAVLMFPVTGWLWEIELNYVLKNSNNN